MGLGMLILFIVIIVAFVVACFWGHEPGVCRRTKKYCGKAEDCVCATCVAPVENCKRCDYWNGCTTEGGG